jgi:hypothetical protein
MNWEAVGAVAELLGALGVIISLIYLATQIRQNTRSVRMSSHHGVADQFTQTNLAVVHDPQLIDLITRGSADAESLSDAERTRFYAYIMAIFRTYEELFQLDRKGLADRELWEARRRSMRSWLARPGIRSWWSSEWSEMFVNSFREAVEEEVKTLDSTAVQ